MKIAVCFSGQVRTGLQAAPHLFDWFGDLLPNIDFFIHTWDNRLYKNLNCTRLFPRREEIIDKKVFDELSKIYNPKTMEIESGSVYLETHRHKGGNNEVTTHPLWYSFYKSVLYKRLYEKKNKFKYDIVVKLRMDLVFTSGKLIDEIKWLNENSDKSVITEPSFHKDWKNKLDDDATIDIYFVSDSDTMDIFSQLFFKDCYTYRHFYNENLNPLGHKCESLIIRDVYAKDINYPLKDNDLDKIDELDGYYYDTVGHVRGYPITNKNGQYAQYIQKKYNIEDLNPSGNPRIYLDDLGETLL